MGNNRDERVPVSEFWLETDFPRIYIRLARGERSPLYSEVRSEEVNASGPQSDTLSPGVCKSTHPRVSVIIAYYEQESFIAETVRSVQQQTYTHFEIIVVDDGSPVPAASVLPESSEVLVLRTENRGCAAARNFGFKQSSGDFLVFLDSDDRLTPGALEAHLKAFAECPAAALSFGAQRFIDEDSLEIRASHNCRPRKNYFLMLLEGNPIGTPGAAMIRREA